MSGKVLKWQKEYKALWEHAKDLWKSCIWGCFYYLILYGDCSFDRALSLSEFLHLRLGEHHREQKDSKSKNAGESAVIQSLSEMAA